MDKEEKENKMVCVYMDKWVLRKAYLPIFSFQHTFWQIAVFILLNLTVIMTRSKSIHLTIVRYSELKFLHHILIYLFVCESVVYMWACTCTAHVWASHGNSVELKFSFHLYMDARNWTQIEKLSITCQLSQHNLRKMQIYVPPVSFKNIHTPFPLNEVWSLALSLIFIWFSFFSIQVE